MDHRQHPGTAVCLILTRDTTTHMQISALEKALDGLTVEDLASREAVRTQILHLAHGTVAAGLQGSGLDEDVTSIIASEVQVVPRLPEAEALQELAESKRACAVKRLAERVGRMALSAARAGQMFVQPVLLQSVPACGLHCPGGRIRDTFLMLP